MIYERLLRIQDPCLDLQLRGCCLDWALSPKQEHLRETDHLALSAGFGHVFQVRRTLLDLLQWHSWSNWKQKGSKRPIHSEFLYPHIAGRLHPKEPELHAKRFNQAGPCSVLALPQQGTGPALQASLGDLLSLHPLVATDVGNTLHSATGHPCLLKSNQLRHAAQCALEDHDQWTSRTHATFCL